MRGRQYFWLPLIKDQLRCVNRWRLREAVRDILEDEGLDQLERIPVDYDELLEKAEEVEAEILQEARSQRKRV